MDKNKEIISKFYLDAINKGNEELINEILAENFIDHNASPDLPEGRNGFKQFLKMLVVAFPDIRVQVEDIISEKDKVAVRLTISGSQTGVLLGQIPPSGKTAVWTGIDILKIENGKITERWSQRDLLGMMRQIGAIT